MTSTRKDQDSTYPAHFQWDVVLRTGSTLHIRPVRKSDENELLDFFSKLSPESFRTRFFDARKPDDALRSAPADIDYENVFGLVGDIGGRIVGVAHYYRSSQDYEKAEAAFTVADEMRGCGIGTRLLEQLAAVARDRGITTFFAEVMEENRRMMDVFLDSGFEVQRGMQDGVYRVSFLIEETELFEERSADRDQKAAFASMKSIFAPKSIAVVGASTRRGQLGAEVFHNLVSAGFNGRLYPVNPAAETVEYVQCYPRVSDIPGPVDLAIVVVPAKFVDAVVDDCVKKGVRAIVMITAGFGEIGPEGREREKRILDKVRAGGMRMVGPNCMGVLNANPEVSMLGTFSSVFPSHGNIAMSTQSGALGLAILDYANRLGVGFSTFVSVGNKADVSGNDLIQYWAEDQHTDVMLLYLESFGNPTRFGRIARRVGRKKPIIAVKSGRSESGARAASSHTGALATSDAIVDDLFRQAGIIRTDTLEEMFDVAQLLAQQPLPQGRRVGIVTNAGGPGILAADACEARGLSLSKLTDSTTSELRSFLPREASVGNPVDMIASATAEQYRRAIDLLLADENVDALVVIYIPVMPKDAEDVAKVIRESSTLTRGKPMIANFMGASEWATRLSPIPSFPFPERAANALARAARYAEWRRKPVGSPTRFEDIDEEAARAIIDRALTDDGTWLAPEDCAGILRAAGIPLAETREATSLDDALSTSIAIGYPVVLKAAGDEILHKSDVGGVKLNLENDDDVREAYDDMSSRLGSKMTGVVVQKMITEGPEMMLGIVRDATFGHLAVYGAGGTLVELLGDVAFRILPLTEVDTHDMMEEVNATSLLRGYRGAPPADESSVRQLLLRLSNLVEACPEIEELDINPVKVMTSGAIAVDMRIRISPLAQAAATRRITY